MNKSTTYLNDGQIAVFSVCAQVKNVPLHINGGWERENKSLFFFLIINYSIQLSALFISLKIFRKTSLQNDWIIFKLMSMDSLVTCC